VNNACERIYLFWGTVHLSGGTEKNQDNLRARRSIGKNSKLQGTVGNKNGLVYKNTCQNALFAGFGMLFALTFIYFRHK